MKARTAVAMACTIGCGSEAALDASVLDATADIPAEIDTCGPDPDASPTKVVAVPLGPQCAPCPIDLPEAGAPCPAARVVCEYGDSNNTFGNTIVECLDSGPLGLRWTAHDGEYAPGAARIIGGPCPAEPQPGGCCRAGSDVACGYGERACRCVDGRWSCEVETCQAPIGCPCDTPKQKCVFYGGCSRHPIGRTCDRGVWTYYCCAGGVGLPCLIPG